MLVKCKFCGTHHPMREPCKALGQGDRPRPSESAPKVSRDRSPAAPPRSPLIIPPALAKDIRIGMAAPEIDTGEAKFDKRTYQREYMRKRRAEAKRKAKP